MTNSITCKVQGGDKLKHCFGARIPDCLVNRKSVRKLQSVGFLPKEQYNVLHIPKNGSTFLFYWHKDKIMMKTVGRMTLILESPKNGGCNQ